MRILLINSNQKVDMLAAPPLGLCYVARAAEAANHRVKVVDLCFSGNNLRPFLEREIEAFQPQVIGLSIRNVDNVNMLHPVSYVPDILTIRDIIREFSDAPLVLGGSGASLVPESMVRLFRADYIVVADGEQAFVELVDALERGANPAAIPGVGMLVDGDFHLTKPRFSDFEGGSPDLGRWVDMQPYQDIGSSYIVQTKRGCRQNCIYCTYNQSLEGNALRLRSPVDVVDEIEEAVLKYKPTTFEFVDSVFNDPVDHAAAILEEIIRRPWKAELTAMGVHPRDLDDGFLNLMWRAGFRSFMITPESASDTMLRSYRKSFNAGQVVKAAEAISRTSFAAWWFFMIGGPRETNETLQESLDFGLKYLRRQGGPATHVAHYFLGVRVYPNTGLWRTAVEEGFVQPGCDPLQTLWYLSEGLDLPRAVNQMTAAAATCPEIYLGFDERILVFSRAAAIFFELFGFPRPYWRYFPSANRFGLRFGLRFMYQPPDVVGMLRDALRNQGYRGRLLGDPPR